MVWRDCCIPSLRAWNALFPCLCPLTSQWACEFSWSVAVRNTAAADSGVQAFVDIHSHFLGAYSRAGIADDILRVWTALPFLRAAAPFAHLPADVVFSHILVNAYYSLFFFFFLRFF